MFNPKFEKQRRQQKCGYHEEKTKVQKILAKVCGSARRLHALRSSGNNAETSLRRIQSGLQRRAEFGQRVWRSAFRRRRFNSARRRCSKAANAQRRQFSKTRLPKFLAFAYWNES